MIHNKVMQIISKIETRNSLINLKDIIKQSDAILIDRGDLSREIPLEEIPIIQKEVIKKVKQNDKSVYIATNLLESMVVEKTPNRAEINDIMNTLIDGADGLVLAAETAIGSNPLLCISIINRVISAYKIITKKEPNNKILLSNTISHLGLISPYGGNIKIAKPSKIDREDQSIVTIPINRRFILDAEQIAIGGFSPIKGFMNTDEIYNVLINQKLQDGTFWPLPIFLQVHKTIAMKLKIGEKYILQDEKTGLNHSLIQVSDIKKINFKETNKLMFGTNSQNHPGVNSLKNNGEYFIGGNITLIKSIQLPYSTYLLTPLKTRQIFEKKGWHKVAGFHSRNVVHRGHEFIHKKVLPC